MPSLHSSLYRQGRGRFSSDGTVAVEGLVALQKALKLAEGNTDKHLKKRLREAAKPVQDAARKHAPNVSGALESSIRLSVTQRSVSVYSRSPYAYPQERGAWSVGRGPHIQRANASHYMRKAVNEKSGEVNRRMEEVLDDLSRDFES